MVVETPVAPDVPIAFRTGDSNVGESARKADYGVTARLVAGVRASLVHALLHPLRTYLLEVAGENLAIT